MAHIWNKKSGFSKFYGAKNTEKEFWALFGKFISKNAVAQIGGMQKKRPFWNFEFWYILAQEPQKLGSCLFPNKRQLI